jgi:hypothetical protein
MSLNWENISIKKLTAIVSDHLKKNGIEVVLVGGGCVSLYSNNKYMSQDIDLVTETPLRKIIPIMKEMGFENLTKGSRLFKNPKCEFLIDFVAPPLAIGDEPVYELNNIKTSLGSFNLLTPHDCVRDRLCAYFYWNDLQSLEQAVLVAETNKINFQKIKKWAISKGQLEKYKIFRKQYRERKES